MKIRLLYLFILLSFFNFSVKSQIIIEKSIANIEDLHPFQEDRGTIIFRLYPVKEKLYIKIQDSVYTNPKITLPSGKYNVSLWTPNRVVLDTMVQLFSDSVVYFTGFLHPTPKFRTYNQLLKQHKRKVVLPKTLTLAMSTTLTIGSMVSYIKLQNQWKRVEDNYYSYQVASPFNNGITRSEEDLEKEKDKYNRQKKRFIGYSIATGVSWAVSALIYYKLRNKKRPILLGEDPPFRISYSPIMEGTHLNNAHFCLTFTKKLNNE